MNSKKVVIVGGGTAAWMTANLFAHKWQHENVEITVIEAPDIATIGVGEGSTPYLRSFFSQLNIKESEWMPACNATYKCGIEFKNWSTRPHSQSYFHPFSSELDQPFAAKFEHNTLLRRQGFDVDVKPDDFYMMAHLAKNYKLPINNQHNNIYAYHFDATLLGQFLQQHAQKKLNVNYQVGKVTQVEQHSNDDIKSVTTDNNKTFEADLFVDCTGFSGILMQKTLNVPFISYASNLLNDAAVAVSTPKNASTNKAQTTSTAMSNGWRWHIPLQSRDGNGYVYSSTYQSAQSAENELRQALTLTDDTPVKHIKMRVGRLEQHWKNNCLAIGLSQGFIEPLEATALHLVQDSIERFLAVFKFKSALEQQAEQTLFNDVTNYGFERIRDYIVLHYIMNSREDTQYWRDSAKLNDISTELAHLLGVWFNGQNLKEELAILNLEQYYGSISWHSLLAGYGVFPDVHKVQTPPNESTKAEDAITFYKPYLTQYPNINASDF